MKAGNIKLLNLLGSNRIGERTFSVPVYQRNYDWEKDQCTTLFTDILNIVGTGNKHFLGTILYISEDTDANKSSKLTIIDGQQRLTTIMLLLRAIMDSTNNQNLKDKIYTQYLTNPESPDAHFRLELKSMKQEADTFQKIMDNAKGDGGKSTVRANYNLFKNLIGEFIESQTPQKHANSEEQPAKTSEEIAAADLAVEKIFDAIGKIEIVYIELSTDEENPQLVFESINSTGLALKQADLIRNYILLSNNSTEQNNLYNNYWVKLEDLLQNADTISEYIKDYLTLKHAAVLNKSKVYMEFKKFREEYKNLSTEELLKELNTYSEYYAWFKYCKNPNKEINKRLKQLQILNSTVSYPFLLGLFAECYKKKTIDEAELLKTLDIILIYIIRRLLCGMPVNVFRELFSKMAIDIDSYPDLPMHEKVVTVLAHKTGSAIFPNDTILRERLLTRDLYDSPYTKFILSTIEDTYRPNEQVKLEDAKITIEHIMPQTLTEEWKSDLGPQYQEIHEKYLHSIGNLTLTGYNPALSNASFAKKKEIYKESKICITKELAENEIYKNHWGENEILKRADELIEVIKSIWECPKIVADMKHELDTRTDFTFFSNDVIVKGRTPVQFDFLGKPYNVSSWKDILKQLCLDLYRNYPETFRSLSQDTDLVTGKHNRIINVTSEKMHTPFKIGENLYIETNKSAENILKWCRKILEKFSDEVKDSASFKLKDPTIE